MFRGASGFKERNRRNRVKESLCNLCALALGLALHCWWVETTIHSRLRSCFTGFRSCLVSQNVFHVVINSLAGYCLYIFVLFWLIRSLVDPTWEAFIVCRPLQLLVSHKIYTAGTTIPPGLEVRQNQQLYSYVLSELMLKIYFTWPIFSRS